MIIKALPTIGPKTMIALGITYRAGEYDIPDGAIVEDGRGHVIVSVRGQQIRLTKPPVAVETEADRAIS